MELHLSIPLPYEGRTLREFLRSNGVSAAAIKAIKYSNPGFLLDGEPVHANALLHSGQVLSFTLPPEPGTTVEPQPIPLSILYQDEFAMVLDKPAGIAVHPTLNYPDGTLANGYCWEMQRQGRRAVFRPVNRIDKNTSGLVLCAQNGFSAPFLAESAQKRYLAVVEGELPLGVSFIDAPIGRRGDSIIGRCVTPDGKPSRTEYSVLAVGHGFSLVECRLLTGRTHQIRVHFSYIGHPLAGDDLYGGSRGAIDRHALHCRRMEFRLPFGAQPIAVESPLPSDMAALVRYLQN